MQIANVKIVHTPSVMSPTNISWFCTLTDASANIDYSTNSYPTKNQLELLLKSKLHEMSMGIVDPTFFTPIGDIK